MDGRLVREGEAWLGKPNGAGGLFELGESWLLYVADISIQSNPHNGSPDNGSIRLIVQIFASPILYCSLSKPLLDNGSIH